MSDDLSKQSHAKFESIIPATPTRTQGPEMTEQSASESPRESSQIDESYQALRKGVVDLESRFNAFVHENAEILKKEKEARANVEQIESQISDLRNRIAKFEELAVEIRALKDGILLAEEGIRKVGANLDAQSLKLKQLDASNVEMKAALNSSVIREGSEAVREVLREGAEIFPSATPPIAAYVRRCVYCGSAIERSDRFCNRCGRRAV